MLISETKFKNSLCRAFSKFNFENLINPETIKAGQLMVSLASMFFLLRSGLFIFSFLFINRVDKVASSCPEYFEASTLLRIARTCAFETRQNNREMRARLRPIIDARRDLLMSRDSLEEVNIANQLCINQQHSLRRHYRNGNAIRGAVTFVTLFFPPAAERAGWRQ